MGSIFAVQMGENLLDNHRVFDAGDDLDVAAAAASLDLDVEQLGQFCDVKTECQTNRPTGSQSLR